MTQKRNKTKTRLLSLSEEEKNEVGLQVELAMKKEMAYLVNLLVRNYEKAVAETFGWDREDLMQYVRISLWKGLATFDASLGYRRITYLSNILNKDFLNLSKKCKTKKHSLSKLYCPEELFAVEEIIFKETGEDWVRYAQSFSILLGSVNRLEQKIMVRYLIYGDNVEELCVSMKLKRSEVIGIIKDIKERVSIVMGGSNEPSNLV